MLIPYITSNTTLKSNVHRRVRWNSHPALNKYIAECSDSINSWNPSEDESQKFYISPGTLPWKQNGTKNCLLISFLCKL